MGFERLHLREINLEGLGISLFLLSAPAVEVYCLATGSVILNFGSRGLRGLYIYGIAAPLVGFLLLKGHDRARFSLYVFLSIDALRAIRIFSPAALILDLSLIGYMQTPRMRNVYPKLEREKVIMRMKRKRERIRGFVHGRIEKNAEIEVNED